MAFFILTRFVLVKTALVERPSQGTSSLASRLTTVSLDTSQCTYLVEAYNMFMMSVYHVSGAHTPCL